MTAREPVAARSPAAGRATKVMAAQAVLTLPQRPDLGIGIDLDAVQRYRLNR